MRFLPSLLLILALPMQAAGAVAFDVTQLAVPAAPSGDVVLSARSDGGLGLAYYSAGSQQVIYGSLDAGVWNFEVVADAIASVTEVALDFDAAGSPVVLFGNPGIQRARRADGTWSHVPLVAQSGPALFDFQFAANGDLCLAYADGTLLRYLRRSAVGAEEYSTVFESEFGVRSIDLELDSSGTPHVAWWAGYAGNATSEGWGRSWYAVKSSSVWSAQFVLQWAYAPSLALSPADVPYVSCFRYNSGQRLMTPVNAAWGQIIVDSDYYANKSQTGSALQLTPDGEIHLLKRSTFWRRADGIQNTASVPQASTMGREGMVVDADGNVFAVYRNGSYLRFGQLMMADVPAPQIVDFGGPTWIYEDRGATLHWDVLDAGGIRIEPLGQSFDADDDPAVQVFPLQTTEYTLSAHGLTGSATATHTIEVLPHEPSVRSFVALPDQITATQEVSLRWDTEWADTIVIEPIGLQTTEPHGARLLTPSETTTYSLTATSEHGIATAELTVEVVRPFEIRSFTASHGIVGSQDEVQLEWEVFGLGTVEIEDVGPVDQEGSIFVVPGATRSYTLTASHDGVVQTATVNIEVNDEFQNSRFYLSWSPDEIDLDPPTLGVFQNFTVYVLGVSLEGGAIAGVEFGVEYPPGLMLLGSNFYSDRMINIVSPPDFIVGLGLCIILDDVHRIASLNFMAADQQTIDEGDIRLRPAIIPSIPGRVAYATCAFDLNGSELEGPLAQALQGPPLYLSATSVPVLEAGLSARWVDGRATLHWSALPTDLVDELQIARAVDGGAFETLISFRGGEIDQLDRWVDIDAPAASQLRYALRANANERTLIEEIAKLDPAEDLPERTQFVGAYPNPFNPRTTLRFAVDSAGLYELRVMNAAGRILRTMHVYASGPGTQERDWDGRDDTGMQAASGVYFVQLVGSGALDQLRILLLK